MNFKVGGKSGTFAKLFDEWPLTTQRLLATRTRMNRVSRVVVVLGVSAVTWREFLFGWLESSEPVRGARQRQFGAPIEIQIHF